MRFGRSFAVAAFVLVIAVTPLSAFTSGGYQTGEWLLASGYGPVPPDELPSPMYGSEPIVDPLRLSISNATTLSVRLTINGELVQVVAPGTREDPIDPSNLPEPPWHIEASTTSGRVLVAIDVAPGDVWHTEEGPNGGTHHRSAGARADLSCGRLDVWSGAPMLGPAPPSSFPPGDCDP